MMESDNLKSAPEDNSVVPDDPKPAPLLTSFDVKGIAKHIEENGKVMVMVGAGMSCSAGIPDFRTPGTGLYDNLQKYDLPQPEAIFSLDFFEDKPDAFYHLAKELYPGNFCPTPAHYFIKLLHDKGKLIKCYTQNIDSLEAMAGLPKDQIVAAHGNFDSAKCIANGKNVDTGEVREAILNGKNGERGWEAMNKRHGGLVKPDIVFFGEQLPERYFHHLTDFYDANLLIVLGTSLAVHPFAGLIDNVRKTTPRMLINREKVGCADPRVKELAKKFPELAGQLPNPSDGFQFEEDERYRDVFYQGDCDDGVRELAVALGWEVELAQLVKEGRENFEQLCKSKNNQGVETSLAALSIKD